MIGQLWIGRLGVVAACLLLVGSCGDSDETSTTDPVQADGGDASTSDPLVQAIAENILADPNAPFFSRASADCFAVEIVASIGEERLDELGFTLTSIPDEFQTDWSGEEVDTIMASLEACADLDEAARNSLPDEMSDGDKDCVLRELGDDFFVDALRAEFEAGTDSATLDAESDAGAALFFAAIEACIGPVTAGDDGDPALTTTVADLGVAGVIGFESDRDGNPEIYALDIGTGETRRLTDDSAYDNAAEWSPDGTRIVFQSRRNRDWGVYSMAADGNDIQILADDAGFPRWSPDGSRIVFVAGDGPDIYTMDPDGDNVVQLTSDPGFDSFPDWSPDGTRIIFQSDRNGANELLIMDSDGGNLAPLGSPVFGGGPVWSPDGTRIAFHSSRDGNTDVYVINADGSEVTRLTGNRAVDVFPDWSPDGSFLTFTSDRDGDFEIYVMSADGARVAQLTDNTDRDFGASWDPTSG